MNRVRKQSHAIQRKRLLSRQKHKVHCRRQAQFMQENNPNLTIQA